MPRLLLRFLFLTIVFNVPATTYAGTLLADIDRCIKNISLEQGTKNVRLKAELDFYCPGLTDKVNRSSIARNLSWKFDSSSSINELRDLRQFLGSGRGPAGTAFRYQYEKVDEIVAGVLQKTPEDAPDLWDQFWEWARQYLPHLDQEELDRIDEFMDSITMPEWLNKTIFYGSGVLILLAAAWIIFREWRYYRRVGAYRKLVAGGGAVLDVNREIVITSLDEVPGLPLGRQVPALLVWVIRFFERQGALPANHSLTSRELARILAGSNNQGSGYFAELVGESERVVYGNRVPPEDRVTELLAGARRLGGGDGATEK